MMRRISSYADLQETIRRIETGSTGEIAFAAKNIETEETILLNDTKLFPSASTIKLAILAELYRRAGKNSLDLLSRVEMTEDDIVGGSGILKETAPGIQPSLYDLATLMIVVSDNTATNMILDQIGGVEPVNKTMISYDLSNLILHNRIDFERIGDDVRRFAEGSAGDFMRLNELLLRGELISPQASEAMIGIMEKQQYLDQVPRFLNVFPGAKEIDRQTAITVACKTGFFPGTRVDAGVILLPDDVRIAYCAMTTGSTDLSITPESEPTVVNGLLGRAMVEYWWPPSEDFTDVVLPSPYVDAVFPAV